MYVLLSTYVLAKELGFSLKAYVQPLGNNRGEFRARVGDISKALEASDERLREFLCSRSSYAHA